MQAEEIATCILYANTDLYIIASHQMALVIKL